MRSNQVFEQNARFYDKPVPAMVRVCTEMFALVRNGVNARNFQALVVQITIRSWILSSKLGLVDFLYRVARNSVIVSHLH